MGMLDVLQQYAGQSGVNVNEMLQQLGRNDGAGTADVQDHFDTVARHAPPQVVGEGIAEALRSGNTPPFAELAKQLFNQSNPQQKAGLLNQLALALGPAVLAKMGGMLGSALPALGGGNAPATVTPAAAEKVSPEQIQEMAAHAERQDPSVIDRIGGFYAQHPEVVKGLGGAALAIALGRIATRMQST